MIVVSVIIPIYKGNRYIPKLIRMLEENWLSANRIEAVQIEMILVNDFPAEKLETNGGQIRNIACSCLENEHNRGIHFSRVRGFRHSAGDYILFLDQDDEISTVFIREQLNALKDYDAIICNGKNCSRLIYRNVEELCKSVDENEYRQGHNRIVSPGQVLLKRKAVPEQWLDNIMEENGADDYFLWMLMFCQKKKMMVQDKVLYWHVISGNNASGNRDRMDRSVLEMAKKLRILGYLTCNEEQKIRESRLVHHVEEDITVEKYQKAINYREILELWMVLRDRKISFGQFFLKQEIREIAIYGAGILGKHLYHELQECGVQVRCFLDRKTSSDIEGIKCLIPGDSIGKVDAIVVTPFMEYMEIRKQLGEYYSCDVISIETVLLNVDCELLV